METPLVSILIPTYRRRKLLQRAIGSVYDQTYTEWELIISDDDPSDNPSWEFVNELALKDKRVRAVKNAGVHGQVGNSNTALRCANGEWLKFLHDDDVLKPNCLAELVEISSLGDNIVSITCAIERFVNGKLSSSYWRSGWPLLEIIPQDQILVAMYLNENTEGARPSQKMIHRSVVERGVLMEQPPGLRWMVDSWFNVRTAACGDLLLYRKPLVEWHQGRHVTETDATSEIEQEQELLTFKNLLWKLIQDRTALPPPALIRQMRYFQLALLLIRRGKWSEGYTLLKRVKSPRAYWIMSQWALHNISKGRYARARRITVSREVVSKRRKIRPRGDLIHRKTATAGSPVKRLFVLFSRLSGYMACSLHAVEKLHSVEITVVRVPPKEDAPFEDEYFNWIPHLYDRDALTSKDIFSMIEKFDPQAIFMSGWSDKGYLQAARSMKRRGTPIIAGSDTQWSGSIRQQIGRMIAPWYLHSAIDVLWVAGERQRQLATKVGFTGEKCWSGYYSCDWDAFARVYRERPPSPDKTFLYAGRYISVKGLDDLLEAYRLYRSRVREPWSLICAGAGNEKLDVSRNEGVVDLGFVQPSDLPVLMGNAAALILPSRKEPWGVVIHEATAAGLPVICSESCGAAVHLVQDNYNGYIFRSGDVENLASDLVRLTLMSPDEWTQMSNRSHALSKQFTPERWANVLINGIENLLVTSIK